MRNGPSRLHLPLKLLALAAGLMLLCLAAMQALPLFRSTADQTVATEQTSESPAAAANPSTAVDDQIAEPTSALSGSAAGELSRAPQGRPPRRPTTIDMKWRQADDDSAPMPPPPTSIDEEITDVKFQQLQERIDDLERETAEWRRIAAELPLESQREVDALQRQFQDQQSELHSVSQQVAVLNERLRTMQEDFHRVESARPAERTEGQPAVRISIRTVTEKGKPQVVLDARDASLPELLARLGEVLGVNLLVSPDVTGIVSLHLKVANGEEALDAVCRAHHCRQERTGSFVVVAHESVTEKGTAKSAAAETVTKLYRLQHLSGPEMRPYVQALLTPGLGTVSFTTIRERVGRTEYRDPPRAILVKDTAQVISEVDRLILELDRPPTKGKSLRPLSQTRMEQLLQTTTAPPPVKPTRTAAEPKLEPVPRPPSEAWPSRRPAPAPEPAPVPIPKSPAGPALLPTGTDLPGPCLDCEVFEPPLVQEETVKK